MRLQSKVAVHLFFITYLHSSRSFVMLHSELLTTHLPCVDSSHGLQNQQPHLIRRAMRASHTAPPDCHSQTCRQKKKTDTFIHNRLLACLPACPMPSLHTCRRAIMLMSFIHLLPRSNLTYRMFKLSYRFQLLRVLLGCSSPRWSSGPSLSESMSSAQHSSVQPQSFSRILEWNQPSSTQTGLL